MECWAPAVPEQKLATGKIIIHMDGISTPLDGSFNYHPDARVFQFENDETVLLLKPGDTEVSLHVCLNTKMKIT